MAATNLSKKNGTLCLQGELRFDTVNAVSAQLEQMFTQDVVALDCAAVTTVDSAAVALLLYALQLAHQKKSPLKIIAMTDAITRLMKLYGLEKLLSADGALDPSSPEAL